MSGPGAFGRLVEEYRAGGITRRQFLARAGAVGVGTSVAAFVASTVRVARAGAQETVLGAPAEGMEGRTRGEGGELKLL